MPDDSKIRSEAMAEYDPRGRDHKKIPRKRRVMLKDAFNAGRAYEASLCECEIHKPSKGKPI